MVAALLCVKKLEPKHFKIIRGIRWLHSTKTFHNIQVRKSTIEAGQTARSWSLHPSSFKKSGVWDRWRRDHKKYPAFGIAGGESIKKNSVFSIEIRQNFSADPPFTIVITEKILANGDFRSIYWKKLDKIGLHYKNRWKNWIDRRFSIAITEKILAAGDFRSK